MRIQQPKRDLRIAFQPSPNRRRNRLTGLAAQPRLSIEFDDNPAHGPHFVEPRSNAHTNAKALEHSHLQALQVFQILQILKAFDQAFFFLPGKQQDALGRWRALGQVFSAAVAGARGARLA